MGYNKNRLTHEQSAEVARLYTEGVLVKVLAERFKISRTNVYGHLRQHGVIPSRVIRSGADRRGRFLGVWLEPDQVEFVGAEALKVGVSRSRLIRDIITKEMTR